MMCSSSLLKGRGLQAGCELQISSRAGIAPAQTSSSAGLKSTVETCALQHLLSGQLRARQPAMKLYILPNVHCK